MRVHERIKYYISHNGLKMSSIAVKSGIHPKRFYRVIDGSSRLLADEYESICKNGLELDPGYFFDYDFSVLEKLKKG